MVTLMSQSIWSNLKTLWLVTQIKWSANSRNPYMDLSRRLDIGIWTFLQVILSSGLEMNVLHECIYHWFSRSKYIILVLCVDDILLVNNDIDLLWIKISLSKKFKMKDLGDAYFVLGLKIHQYCSGGILALSQEGYI